MPTYEYECSTCNHRFEIFQNMSDEEIKICPQCGEKVQRVIHGGTGIIFKGSGPYSKDHAQNTSLNRATRCGKETTCCGRETPCDKPPCK